MNTMSSLIRIAKKFRAECEANIALTNSERIIRGYLGEIKIIDETLKTLEPRGSSEVASPKITIDWLPAEKSLVARDLGCFKEAVLELSAVKTSEGNLFLPIKRINWINTSLGK